jgi:hypothetical protein
VGTRVLQVKGATDELRLGVAAIQKELGVAPDFPAGVKEAAGRAARSPRLPERDLAGLEFLTIDPVGAMDLDQAMHLEADGDGHVVHYAIADVMAFLEPGDPVDKEARRRGEWLYGAGSKVPLHPKVLSEGAASLLRVRSAPPSCGPSGSTPPARPGRPRWSVPACGPGSGLTTRACSARSTLLRPPPHSPSSRTSTAAERPDLDADRVRRRVDHGRGEGRHPADAAGSTGLRDRPVASYGSSAGNRLAEQRLPSRFHRFARRFPSGGGTCSIAALRRARPPKRPRVSRVTSPACTARASSCLGARSRAVPLPPHHPVVRGAHPGLRTCRSRSITASARLSSTSARPKDGLTSPDRGRSPGRTSRAGAPAPAGVRCAGAAACGRSG